jgi:hypothetical protein
VADREKGLAHVVLNLTFVHCCNGVDQTVEQASLGRTSANPPSANVE